MKACPMTPGSERCIRSLFSRQRESERESESERERDPPKSLGMAMSGCLSFFLPSALCSLLSALSALSCITNVVSIDVPLGVTAGMMVPFPSTSLTQRTDTPPTLTTATATIVDKLLLLIRAGEQWIAVLRRTGEASIGAVRASAATSTSRTRPRRSLWLSLLLLWLWYRLRARHGRRSGLWRSCPGQLSPHWHCILWSVPRSLQLLGALAHKMSA
mmetsp:Transcript_1281/g.3948  ORF Transcript_1281/g.3948 Transcript_1281/m.3948 type:complete len:216 (-) Transcript_1281:213-860(-)